MTFPDSVLAGVPRAGVALVQVSLVALLGLLAWLVARRSRPALRGVLLLATLVGLLAVPALAAVAPTWLPLPECFCPANPASAEPVAAAPAPPPPPTGNPAFLSIRVVQPPVDDMANAQTSPQQPGDTTLPLAKAEAVFLNVAIAPESAAPPAPAVEPVRPSWPLAGVLATLWLVGTLAFLIRSLCRLALLYGYSRRARPVGEKEWTDCVASLAERYGTGAVALRESPVVASPLTLGLFRPVILLPPDRRDWSSEERSLILGHELAHVRRRDFLAGLVAEVVLCLCWFHPLVRWLAGRLRLEQEYAADAWVASAAGDSRPYVWCLARLALEQDRGHGSPAPALWRRRPEILRRIDMLQRNPKGLPPRLGSRASWVVAGLTAAACLTVAGVGPLPSSEPPGSSRRSEDGGDEPRRSPTADQNGDPLPKGALARLGTTRLRHGADVTYVAFGADGKTLLTAGQDGTIRLWNLAQRKEIRRFDRPRPVAPKLPPKENKPIRPENFMQLMNGARNAGGSFRVALAADGKTLAAAGGNVVQLWAVETGKELRQIQGPPGGLAGLLFSPDGRTLAGRTSGGGLFLWAVATGKELHHIEPARRQQNGNFVLIIGGGRAAAAPGMTFTPHGKALVAAMTDYKKDKASRSIKFWDVASGKEIRKIEVPDGVNVSALAIAPDGKVLAYAGGNVIHLCAADTGKEIRALRPADGGALSLVFASDGKTLAVRGRNQRVRLWTVETGKELHQLSDAEPARQGGGLAFVTEDFFAPEVRALALSPDGQRVAAAAGSTVRLWETTTGKELPLLAGHWRAPSAIVLSADGKTAVSWGFDRVVRRWETATGKSLGNFPAPPRTTLAAFSGDGRIIALANADNTIRLHDTTTSKELRRLKGGGNGTAALAFAPGGKVLAARSRGDNIIRLYDVARGVELRQIAIRPKARPAGGTVIVFGGPGRDARGPGLAFSPDGKLLVAPVSGNNERSHTLAFFDVATGKELRKIESPQAIVSLAFSPDSRTLATENANRTITFWEVASGKQRNLLGKAVGGQPQGNAGMMAFEVALDGLPGGFSEPGGPVGLVFAPDGRTLAVRGSDRTVKVWEVATGKVIDQLKGHGGRIETVAFAADGKALASGASDTTILLWDTAGPRKGLSKPQKVDLTAAQVEALWGDLVAEDATRALRSVYKLAAASAQAVPFLGQHLKPAMRVDPRKIDGWIADLESEKFAVRKNAAGNLLKVGEQALPALRKKLASVPQLETRKRVEELVDRLTGGTLTVEQLRLVRAVEALEKMATPEAVKVLRTLAKGAPGALPTREAQAALDRLAGR